MTYSIVAADPATGARGVAVASKALCVGAHVPWGRAGFGALATQAWHDLRYGWQGLALLEEGRSAASIANAGCPIGPSSRNWPRPSGTASKMSRSRRAAS